MIRVTVRTAEASMAVVGGPVGSTYKSFDIAAPELESFLTALTNDYQAKEIIAWEIIKDSI